MGDADVEEQRKNVLPYMQRAQEIQSADPKVAYYCRLYGVDQAMKIKPLAKEINKLLVDTLTKMEVEKPNLGLNNETDKYHCESFALRIFKNADKADCAGKADGDTSKAYYAASFFIEILNQFGPVEPDLLEKQRFAAWRAFDIRKAMREGRTPTPPDIKKAPSSEEGLEASGPISTLPPAYSGPSCTLPPAYGGAYTTGAYSTPQQEPPPGQGLHAYSQPSALPWQPSGGTAHSGNFAQPPDPPPARSASEPSNLGAPPPSQGGSSRSDAPRVPSPPPFDHAAPALSARYGPGSRVLFSESGGELDGCEPGTVGQVMPPDGSSSLFRYRVGLRERFVDASDAQLAANPEDGQPLYFLGEGTHSQPQEAMAMMVNDVTWPPTYLISIKDGKEMEAKSHQVWLSFPPADANAHPSPYEQHQQQRQGQEQLHQQQHQEQEQQQYHQQQHQHQQQPSGPPVHGDYGGYPSMNSQGYHEQSYSAGPGPQAPPGPPQYPGGPHQYQQPQPPRVQSAPPGQYQHPPPPTHHAPPSYQAPPPAPAPVPAPAPIPYTTPKPGWKPNVTAINDAQKACRTAISSLNFDDVTSAVKYLHDALRALQPPSQ